MFVVLVADTAVDPQGHADPEVIGPFATREEATDWALREMRYVVHVIPLTMRNPS